MQKLKYHKSKLGQALAAEIWRSPERKSKETDPKDGIEFVWDRHL